MIDYICINMYYYFLDMYDHNFSGIKNEQTSRLP